MGVEVNYLRADARELPFGNAVFESAIDWGCTHSLDREGQTIAAKETARVIKPGGSLLYFGFNKNHPSAKGGNPKYRDLEDVREIYGADFEIVYDREISWDVLPEENADYSKHVGTAVLMVRKGSTS